VVTLTTVGYGDIAPITALGQFLSALLMIMGYGIIAVPTGIVTTELVRGQQREVTTRACQECSLDGHDSDAKFCKGCGANL
jgi:voltage-gated potassium channel